MGHTCQTHLMSNFVVFFVFLFRGIFFFFFFCIYDVIAFINFLNNRIKKNIYYRRKEEYLLSRKRRYNIEFHLIIYQLSAQMCVFLYSTSANLPRWWKIKWKINERMMEKCKRWRRKRKRVLGNRWSRIDGLTWCLWIFFFGIAYFASIRQHFHQKTLFLSRSNVNAHVSAVFHSANWHAKIIIKIKN